MSDLAARLREAFLGTETGEAVPFDDLKPCVCDRWQRVADAAALRVPFSDAQIERMAEAAHTRRMRDEERTKHWKDLPLFAKDAWRQGIRAALAAGGLEPCAVPEYDPSDVALSPTGHVLRDRLVDAEAKIERQRAALATLNNLRQLDAGTRGALMSDISNAVRNAMDRLPDAPWKDKTATEAVWLLSLAVGNLRAEVDEDNAAAASVNDLLVQVQNLTAERDALRERASVPVKVRWDVSAEKLACEAKQMFVGGARDTELARRIMDYLAAHAVIAHLYTRPEGLPTAKSLGAIGRKKYADLNRRTTDHYDEYHFEYVAKAILTALRPWLRDPVGCDLDVTADVIEVIARSSSRQTRAKEIIDLCRKRIKPVYECKECAGMRDEVTFWKRENVASNNKMLAARAALEGE